MSRIKLVNTSTAAAKLGFSTGYVRRLCAEGKIPAQKLELSCDWLINEKEIFKIKRQRKQKGIIADGSPDE